MLETAGMTVVGEAASGSEAVALANKLKPDLVVIELTMADASEARPLRSIAEASPESRIVVLAASDETDVLEIFQAGASGFLFKSTRVEELVGGIRQAARGQVVLSDDAVRRLVSRTGTEAHQMGGMRPGAAELLLTTREMDVLRLIVDGADNVAIGLALSISRHTVKQHVTNIFEKLGVHTRVEAAVYAVRSGLV
jgi:DNA-binding NarL/FixJ family response regulator